MKNGVQFTDLGFKYQNFLVYYFIFSLYYILCLWLLSYSGFLLKQAWKSESCGPGCFSDRIIYEFNTQNLRIEALILILFSILISIAISFTLRTFVTFKSYFFIPLTILMNYTFLYASIAKFTLPTDVFLFLYHFLLFHSVTITTHTLVNYWIGKHYKVKLHSPQFTVSKVILLYISISWPVLFFLLPLIIR